MANKQAMKSKTIAKQLCVGIAVIGFLVISAYGLKIYIRHEDYLNKSDYYAYKEKICQDILNNDEVAIKENQWTWTTDRILNSVWVVYFAKQREKFARAAEKPWIYVEADPEPDFSK
ncbi:MAG: hypothetical protein U0800_15075 [Isosphaeraceae bacterium]